MAAQGSDLPRDERRGAQLRELRGGDQGVDYGVWVRRNAHEHDA
ncbi:hypothetical protein PC116_g32809 [Phytophthora cactorum]|nr:hypothetical protein PC116_g32809 [Phytophthora cactorum]